MLFDFSKEKISVESAIDKGFLLVYLPAFLIMMSFAFGGIMIDSYKLLPEWIIPVSLILSVLFSCLYYYRMLTIWRLWAFERVDLKEKLNTRAIQSRLIYPKGSFMEKLEIRTAEEQTKLDEIDVLSQKPDPFIENKAIPEEIIFRYIRSAHVLMAIFGLLLIISGVWLQIQENNLILLLTSLLTGAYICGKSIYRYFDTAPKLILSEKGITTPIKGLIPWEIITEVKVLHNLDVYYLPHGKVSIGFGDLKSSHRYDMYDIVKTYQARYAQTLKNEA